MADGRRGGVTAGCSGWPKEARAGGEEIAHCW
jgi:hypothetical protein